MGKGENSCEWLENMDPWLFSKGINHFTARSLFFFSVTTDYCRNHCATEVFHFCWNLSIATDPFSGKMGLNQLPDDKFWTGPNWNSLQTTILNLMKIPESSLNRWKTLWVKKKLLVKTNFSFSHSVFKRVVSQGRQKVSLCGNGLMHFCDP